MKMLLMILFLMPDETLLTFQYSFANIALEPFSFLFFKYLGSAKTFGHFLFIVFVNINQMNCTMSLEMVMKGI